MSVESDLVTSLSDLVGDRLYPNTFPQPEVGPPTYPMMRYNIIGTEIDPDICGDGDETTDSVRVQLDIVSDVYLNAMAIRSLVRDAMHTHASPATLEDSNSDFDVETKAHRIRMDYVIYLSST
jgi:hypothetical protein